MHLLRNSMFINNAVSDGASNEGHSHSFENNSAREKGGALFLSKSFLYIMGDTFFIRNKAALGGALFVEDFDDYCNKNLYQPCFFNHSNLTSFKIMKQESYRGKFCMVGY